MKKLLVALVLVLTMGIAGAANAALISDVVHVNRILWGNGFVHWSHVVDPDFTVPYDTVNSASLTISGWFVSGNNDQVLIEQDILLGSLSTGIHSFSVFGLTQYFQAGWGPTDGTFDVTLLYNQRGGMILNSSRLNIDYTNVDPPGGTGDTSGASPVPEPGTMLLLGSGLVGLASWGRKKFHK